MRVREKSRPFCCLPEQAKSPACRTAVCVLVVAAPAPSQDGAHSAVESCTCGCNLWLRRTRRAVPLAPSVPPCGIARTSPGSTPTSPRFPNPTLPLKFLWLELGYILRVSTASPRVTFCMARFVGLTWQPREAIVCLIPHRDELWTCLFNP